MLLKRLIFDNYKTYYGHQELDLYIPEDSRTQHSKNIILIGGLNGAGKTTILKAILYVLFGKRQMDEKEYNRLFSNVLNNQYFDEGGRDCSITLFLETDKKEEWEIKVSWSFDDYKRVLNENRNLTVRKHGARHGQSVKIDNIQVYDRFIDKIIPYYAAPFFIFDGEEIKDTILRQDSHEMKEAIQKITGMNSYKELLSDLRDIKSGLENEIAKVSKSKDMNKIQKALTIENKKIEECQSKIENIRESIATQNEKAQKIKNRRDEKLNINMKSRDKLIKKRTELESSIKYKKEQFNTAFQNNALSIILKSKIEKLTHRIKIEKEQREKKMMLEATLTPYRQFIDELLAHSIEPALSEEQLKQIRAIGEDVWIKENNLSKGNQLIEELHDLSPKEYTSLLSRKNNNRQSIIDLINNIESLEQAMNNMENDISNAPESVDVKEETSALDNILKKTGELELRYKAINSKLKSSLETKKSLSSQIESSSQQAGDLGGLEKKYNDVNIIIQSLEEYIVESTILKAEYIKEEFASMLTKLFRKQDEFGKIDFDTDTYTVRLYNDREQEISIHDRSAGEMQMISSSLIWALTKASDLSMPMVIDTPLGRLDSVHRNHLINHYYKELSEQVIILSTDTEITEEYVELMKNHSYKQYMLDYSEEKKYTVLRDGYFEFVRS
ncbi:DNA sulfur modification protein DndD [Alkalihalophilus pseudofirmus]|uniref:Nuclease SbcCD subunit C n=1 Tax=Alkalihalophilus pseudofirmus TaxID=79885 RepID=A0AAJ2NLQ8_ALKPS|nr:DNA sulfur modification protein DndD [Alkalihalophilus pseudofirmus]MDV2884688.1 DNA sulfur modification protein DndD [Alkalihalophilus pseudofirmus]